MDDYEAIMGLLHLRLCRTRQSGIYVLFWNTQFRTQNKAPAGWTGACPCQGER